MTPETLKQFIRQPYAWPGGYPCALLMADGEVIDSRSARENFRLIRCAMRDRLDRQWTPEKVFIHWEGPPLICAESGRLIESAYGGDDETI
jgi:hypothetical protein